MPVVERSTIDGLYLEEVPDRTSITDPRYWVRATCCTVWDIHLGFRIGRCGKCGNRPMINWEDCE